MESDSVSIQGFIDAYADAEYIYAVKNDYNAFFRINRQSYEAEYIGLLDGFQHESSWHIRSIYRRGDLLFLFSQKSYEIASYNLLTGEMLYHYPDKYNITFDSVRVSCQVGDKVWIFREPFEPLVCVFSLADYSYDFCNMDISELKKFRNDFHVVIEHSCLVGTKIWRCVPGANAFFCFDTDTCEIKVFELAVKVNAFAISYNSGYFYLITMDGKCILVWNEESGLVNCRETGYRGEVRNPFRNIIIVENKMVLIPGREDRILYCEYSDKELYSMTAIERTEKLREASTMKVGSMYLSYYIENEHLYLFPNRANDLLEINLQTMEISKHMIVLNDSDYIDSRTQAGLVLKEKDIGLQRFAKSIKLVGKN